MQKVERVGLAVGLALVALSVGVAANPLPVTVPVGDAQVVVGTLVLADGTFTLDHRIIVPGGSELVIRNAVVYLDDAQGGACVYDCAYDIQLLPGSSMIVEDSRISTTLMEDGEPVPWNLLGKATDVRFVDSVFEHVASLEFELPGSQTSVFSGNSIIGPRNGVTWFRGGSIEFTDNYVEATARLLRLRGVEATITGNTFALHEETSNVAIGVEIDVSQADIHADLPRGYDISNNHFVGLKRGIWHREVTAALVHNNTFEDVGSAMWIRIYVGDDVQTESLPRFVDNDLVGVRQLFFLDTDGNSSGEPVLPIVAERNNVDTSLCRLVPNILYVHELVTIQVDARNNWWGSADGPFAENPECDGATPEQVEVTYEPWATSPFVH